MIDICSFYNALTHCMIVTSLSRPVKPDRCFSTALKNFSVCKNVGILWICKRLLLGSIGDIFIIRQT